ncbi:adenosylmethionine-8-amino-7-oxononanoate aminotransferase [Mesorhizobium sangaii]|uniref:Adenosylmethionine-8-amino-7-oxononanoate aminotransferase n=1 Tax=Mesorhizobium sangaii TaxID=505389 RepID=A0A841PM67_9HYPH|nr:adenosylmethionine-8-amino-7-oxononanoate aminotransferase [Mesorhizobium sangaii]
MPPTILRTEGTYVEVRDGKRTLEAISCWWGHRPRASR